MKRSKQTKSKTSPIPGIIINYYQRHVLCTYLYEVCAECGSSACINISHIPSPLILEIELHGIIIFFLSLELRQINQPVKKTGKYARMHIWATSEPEFNMHNIHARSYTVIHRQSYNTSNKFKQMHAIYIMCALYTAYTKVVVYRDWTIAVQCGIGLPSQLMNNICHNNACNNWR